MLFVCALFLEDNGHSMSNVAAGLGVVEEAGLSTPIVLFRRYFS